VNLSLRFLSLSLAVAAPVFGAGSAPFGSSDELVALDELRVGPDRLVSVRRMVSSRVDVLGHEELAQAGVPDLAGALSRLPNVDVQRYGSVDGEGSLAFYGHSAARTAPTKTVLAIDGVPLNSGLIAETSLNLLPLAAMERLEVLQGPASVAYGSNAMTGAVNFVPRRPAAWEGAVEASYGTWRTSFAAVRAGAGTDEASIAVVGQHRRTDGHLQPDGRRDYSDSQSRNLALFGTTQAGVVRLSLAALHYDWDRHAPTATLPETPLRTAAEEGWRRHYHATATAAPWSDTTVRLAVWRNEATARSVPHLGPGTRSDERTRNDGALLTGQWQSGASGVLVGVEYQEAQQSDRLAGTTRTGDTRGLFAQGRLAFLSDTVAFDGGVRWDETSTYPTRDFTPKIGFAYAPTGARWNVRGQWSRSYKSPSFRELFSTGSPRGNAELTAQAFAVREVAVAWRPAEGWTAGVTLFEAVLTDPIYPRPMNVPPFALQFVNVPDATRTRGATFEAGWRGGPWSFAGSYTYLDPGAATFHTARHTVKAQGAWRTGPLGVEVALLHAARRYWQDGYTDPAADYHTVDVGVEYRWGARTVLRGSVRNLFDETYATGAQPNRITTPPPGFNRWVGLPRPGRQLELAVSRRL
jgi:vitamin B12 transporter